MASTQQLARLGRVLIAIFSRDPATTVSSDGIRASTILRKTMHSAHFWELVNIRTALVSSINEQTLALDRIVLPNDGSIWTLDTSSTINEGQLRAAVYAYEMMLFIPIEYLPRISRQDLIRRAIAGDLVICRLMTSHPESHGYVSQSLKTLRTCLIRWFSQPYSVTPSVGAASNPSVYDAST